MWLWHELVTKQPAWISNLSNLTSITVFGALVGMYKKFNCSQHGCWRVGHHKVEGTTYRTCGRHVTAEVHQALFERHALKRPEQHRFLNGESEPTPIQTRT
jgi:hypothetical protein